MPTDNKLQIRSFRLVLRCAARHKENTITVYKFLLQNSYKTVQTKASIILRMLNVLCKKLAKTALPFMSILLFTDKEHSVPRQCGERGCGLKVIRIKGTYFRRNKFLRELIFANFANYLILKYFYVL